MTEDLDSVRASYYESSKLTDDMPTDKETVQEEMTRKGYEAADKTLPLLRGSLKTDASIRNLLFLLWLEGTAYGRSKVFEILKKEEEKKNG